MRRWLIAAGVAVVVLGSALAVAVANLGRFLDTHRAWLVSRLEREIGRQVAFGHVGVSLWGGPSVSVSDVRVPDDPSYGDGDVLRAREVRIGVRLLPALVGRFQVRHVDVTAPELVVIRDRRGFNLATLGRRPRPHRRRPPAEESAPAPPRSLAALAVLRVHDGTVRFVDRRAEPPLELSLGRLDLSTGHARAGHPIPVEGRAAVLGSEERNFEVTGSVGPLEDPPVVERLPVDLHLRMSDVDVGALIRACAAIDVAVPREMQASGTIALHGRAQGTIGQLSADAKVDASAAEVRLGRVVTKPAGVAFTVETAGVRDGGSLVLSRVALRLLGATLDVTGTIRPGTPPIADVQVASNRATLGDLAVVLPAAAALDVGGTAEAHLTVQGPLQAEPPPVMTGTVQLAGVQVRRRADGLAITDVTTTIAVADGVARIPPTRFRAGDAALEASGSFTAAGRVLAVDRVAGEVFGGTIEGHGRVEFLVPDPRFTVEGAARNVALQPLLAARGSHLAEHMAGRLDADVSLTGAGRRRRKIRRSLAGTARIDVRDGVLRGVNVVDDVLGQVVGVRGLGTLTPARLRKKRPELFGGADTRFQELRASARIADGRATSDDIVMRTDAYTVTGKGSMDADGKVDLTATFVADPTLTTDVLGSLKDARWVMNDAHLLAVPFRVSGQLPELRVKPDPDFVARAVGRAVEEHARDALGRDQKDGTRGLVDDAVRQLQRLLRR